MSVVQPAEDASDRSADSEGRSATGNLIEVLEVSRHYPLARKGLWEARRNLTALDSLLPATLAGVPIKIHGEHGRDVSDLC